MIPTNQIQIINPETGEVKNYTEAEYIAARDAALLSWQTSKEKLEEAKETEMKRRKEAVLFLHDPSMSGKQETVELGNGYKAKTKTPISYGWIKNDEGRADKARIEKALAKIEKDSDAGEIIAERLVKWSPELSLTEYKQLSDKWKKIIDEVIVTTEGTPTLEIVAPKAK